MEKKEKNNPPAPQQPNFFSKLWCGALHGAAWKPTYIPSTGPSLPMHLLALHGTPGSKSDRVSL